MSVYNTPDEWLSQSIQSVLNQSYRDFEFLIVDDGSSQSNKDVLIRYKNRDFRIHIITNDKNIGLTSSLNKAVSLAKGDYIARLDSDDIALPDRFQRQLKCFYENPKLVLCGTGAIRLTNGGEIYCPPLVGDSDELKINLLFGNIFVHSSVMIRTSILKSNGLMYNEYFRAAQDFDLWSRLAAFGDLKNIDEKLCVYREHQEQISCKCNELQNGYRDEIIQMNLKRMGLDVPKQDIERCLNIVNAEGKQDSIWWIFKFAIKIIVTLTCYYGFKSIKMNKRIVWNSFWLMKKSLCN